MRRYGSALLALGLILGGAEQAAAVTCTNIYASASSNGATTLPGTDVGSAVSGSDPSGVCQIGNLALYNGGSGGAFVNSSNNPSNYEFQFDGSSKLTIQEEIGNNGTALNGIDVELYSLASQTSTSPSATLASIFIPYSSGPSGFYNLVSNDALASGWYTISTYLAGSGIGDPNYQVDLTASAAVPEPGSLSILAVSLLSVAALIRRRRRAAEGIAA